MPMAYTENQSLIFLPVLALVALTLVAFVRLAVGRMAAMKDGQDPAYYRAHLGGSEPEAAATGARHWGNLFELPTLFYAGCLSAFVLGGVTGWTLAFAWGYVAARVAQSLVHMTYNHVGHRAGASLVGVVSIFALWANVAVSIIVNV
jgi:hypothetical protein